MHPMLYALTASLHWQGHCHLNLLKILGTWKMLSLHTPSLFVKRFRHLPGRDVCGGEGRDRDIALAFPVPLTLLGSSADRPQVLIRPFLGPTESPQLTAQVPSLL